MIDLKKGQMVFIETIGNRYQKKSLTKRVITSLGPKYIGVNIGGENHYKHVIKFHKDNLREVSDYSANYRLWLSKEQYQENEDRLKYIQSIGRVVSNHQWTSGIKTPQLKRIHDVLIEVEA